MAQVEPYKISDFYGYDQDCSTTTSFVASTSQTFSGVCSASANTTYYHNGSGARPVANDNVYTNSSGTSPLAAGYYRFDPLVGEFFRITGTAGLVSTVDSCGGLGGPP